MKRGRRVALFLALSIWAVLLVFAFYYLFDVYKSISQGIPTTEVFSQQKIDARGEQIILNEGDIVSLESNTNDYSFKVYGVTPLGAEFVVNSFLYFGVDLDKSKKLDLDGDNVYDIFVEISSINGKEIIVSFNKIEEAQTIGEGVAETIGKFENNSRLQSSFLVLISLISFLILLAYITKAYIIPKVEEKRKMSRKSELETFYELGDKFYDLYRKDPAKAKSIYDKANHLYKYMSDEDKNEVSADITKMAKYLKQNNKKTK